MSALHDCAFRVMCQEYGVPVRCPTQAWREAQRRDWEATARAAAAKNISGVFPWLFVDRSPAGGYGAVYNEYVFWSVNDATGPRSRNANLQLCSALISDENFAVDAPRSHVDQDNGSKNSSKRIATPRWSVVAGECPVTASAVQRFLDGENATYTLCRHRQEIGLHRSEVDATEAGGLFVECPAQANNSRGSFIESSAPGARNITLCLPDGDSSCLLIYNSSYGRQPDASVDCPEGTVPTGSFHPQSQPLYLPALGSYAEALKDFDTDAPRKRAYSSFVTVNPEEGAGRWKMWATGFQAMQQANPSGQEAVGVRTACSGTNSSGTGKAPSG